MSGSKQFSQITEDIAVIRNEMKNMSQNFNNFVCDYKDWCKKVNDIENKQIATETKVGNLAVFQSVLSVIIGAIATYLGVRK